MKKRLLVLFALQCVAAHGAWAEKMIDYSLPPGQTLHEPDVIRSPAPLGGAAPLLAAPQGDPAQNPRLEGFMAHYCAPGFTPPLTRGLPAMQECLKNERARHCQLFTSLSAPVQRVVEGAITCLATPSDTPNDPAPDCVTHDSARLKLLQANADDPAASRALLFLPEEITGTASVCLPNGGRP